MDDSKFVPVEIFITVLKVQFFLINDLTARVMALRAALMQADKVPVPPEELARLDAYFRELPDIRNAREKIENLDAVNTTEAIDQLLKNFQGPIQ